MDLPTQEDLPIMEDQQIAQGFLTEKELCHMTMVTRRIAVKEKVARDWRDSLIKAFRVQKSQTSWKGPERPPNSKRKVVQLFPPPSMKVLREKFNEKLEKKLEFTEEEMIYLEEINRQNNCRKHRELRKSKNKKRRADAALSADEPSSKKATADTAMYENDTNRPSTTRAPSSSSTYPSTSTASDATSTPTRMSQTDLVTPESAMKLQTSPRPTTPTAATTTSTALETKPRTLPTSPASTSQFYSPSPTTARVKLMVDSDNEDDVKIEAEDKITFEMPPTNHLDDEFQISAEHGDQEQPTAAAEQTVISANELIQSMKTTLLQKPALLSHFIKENPQLVAKFLDFET